VYAIIEDGGRQYKVSSGDVIDVDVRRLDDGEDKIEFDRVLMVGSGSESRVGTPVVPGAKVIATVQGRIKGPKIDVFNFIRRKGHHRSKGHRQQYLRVRVDHIVA